MPGSATAAHVCAVVLAAGEGLRLRPLTERTPKALCPIGNRSLLDRSLATVASLGLTGPGAVAVNAWYHAQQIVAAVGGRVHVSVETGDVPLGSAGGLGALHDWMAARPVLAVNADAYLDGGHFEALLDQWDGDHVRILGVPARDRRPEFGRYRFAGASLIPGPLAAALPAEPADLVRAVWRPSEAAGRLCIVDYRGTYIDSGTAADYLMANLIEAARGPAGRLIDPAATVTGTVADSVVGAGAIVAGSIEHSVVWPGATVAAGEHLVHAIRYGPDRADTVDVR